MSAPESPALSVVIPSVNGWADLEWCLAALEREGRTTALELLVPERCGPAVREHVARQHPRARVLAVSPQTTIPQMRAQAFRAASAPTVAVIEDHILVPPGWARCILAVREQGQRVIGGTVHNAATERRVDWAAFFCEYSQLCAPLERGPARWLTGNNVAYDRALLDEFAPQLERGYWEDRLHDAFRARGIPLWHEPDLVADHRKHYRAMEYLGQRFLYARGFAALRLEEKGPLFRIGYGLLALPLPAVLLARVVSRAWRGRACRSALLWSLPWIALFVCAWGLGETAGAWLGGGNALARVK